MATVIKIKNIEEGFQSIITNGKHTIIGDEPITSKGTDLGLALLPLLLLLALVRLLHSLSPSCFCEQ